VWWICPHGHEYKRLIQERTINNFGCPYCSKKAPSNEYCLESVNPELALEWNYELNGDITPKDVLPFSSKKYWWNCKKGHVFQMSVNNRMAGRGCRKCSNELRTSFAEQAIFHYLSKIFSNIKNRYKIKINNKQYEIDIYLPDLNLGIEYDGYHHIKKTYLKRDIDKTNLLINNNINMIRIRHNKLPKFEVENCKVFIHNISKFYESLKQNILDIIDLIINNYDIDKEQINLLYQLKYIDIEAERFIIYDTFIENEKKNSLSIVSPELSKEWHPTKNGKLTPENTTYSSGKKVWWVCSKGHEYEACVNHRYHDNNGCPYCSNQKVCIDNCLATLNPELAKQWHPTLNGDLTPYDVTPGSEKKVYWLCDKGHISYARIYSRNQGHGCPECYKEGRKKKLF
jgi:very-short-patch-repair endonuclease